MATAWRSEYAFDGNNVYLAFYENSYDLQAAYLEGVRGNFDGTKAIVTRILAHPDGLAESQITYAQSLLDWANRGSSNSFGVLGSLARSFNALTRIVEADPSSVDSLHTRAMAYFDLGRTEEALADLTAALEIEPKAIDVLITRANLLGRTHKYKEAKRDIDAALAIDPQSQEALNLRGYADFYSGDYAQAVDDFTKTFDPRDEHLLYMRGSSYARLKKYDQALADLEALVQLRPTNAYASRGTVFHYLK